MSKKILENIQQGMTWTSYISSAHGVLTGAGMWKGEVWELMGTTGMAFHYIVHETCCASSVTVYDWMAEHLTMMDRIGIHSDFYQTYYDAKSGIYPLRQKDAVCRIKESIDRGIGVVIWAPTGILEFGIIFGYDEEDGVFFVLDCTGRPADPLLFENLGKSDVPMLSYQIFRAQVDVDTEQVYRDSLRYAVSEWEKEFHISPAYASGRKAYEYLIGSLEKNSFDTFGLAYILAVYADAKSCIVPYLNEISVQIAGLGGLKKATEKYSLIADKFKNMSELFPFNGENGSGCTADRSKAPLLLDMAKECSRLEEEAMSIVAACLK